MFQWRANVQMRLCACAKSHAYICSPCDMCRMMRKHTVSAWSKTLFSLDAAKLCSTGWTDKKDCSTYNFCWNQTCNNGGTCNNGLLDFSCACPDEYTGSVYKYTYIPSSIKNTVFLLQFDSLIYQIQWALVTTTVFVPKDNAIEMNLLLYRILNEQTDM